MQTNTPRGRRVFRTLKESRCSDRLVPNDPYGSHFIGVMNILFPTGERGFIRVLGQARYLVKDVELQHRIDDFVRQEAQHARAHSIVAQQPSFCGKHTTRATNITEALVRIMFGGKSTKSRSLLIFRVAIVAAIEHLTAEMGRWAFEDARFAELECDRAMAELITWHCAEEVIHRSVAFDALVDIAPRWHRAARSVAMLMWMPVCGPIREFHITPMSKMIYLFLNSVVATVPAGWLTFAEGVVYKHYNIPVRVWGISIGDDQQIAGAMMKLGGSAFLWTIIGVMFIKNFVFTFRRENDSAYVRKEEELTTADVERAFNASPPQPEPNNR